MRHLNSLLLSLAAAPAIWVLTGYGLEQHGPHRALLSPAAFVLAGLLFAVLVTARLSPVGPALAGLAYLATVVWLAADPEQVRHTLLETVPAADPAVILRPAEGIAGLLGVPLLVTALSPRRWRRYEGMAALYAGADDRQPTDDRPVWVAAGNPSADEPGYPAQAGYPAEGGYPIQPGQSPSSPYWTQPARPSPWTQPAYRGQHFPPPGEARNGHPSWLTDDTDDLTEQLRPLIRPTTPDGTHQP
jgi:hypothetical protein